MQRDMQLESRSPPSSATEPLTSFSQAQEESLDTSPRSPEGDYESGDADGPSRRGTVDSDLSSAKPLPLPKSNDPYAMLDSAFGGGYVADQPRPVGGRPGEFDDLLL